MPIDNLSVDGNGDIWVAGLPQALKAISAAADPLGHKTPVTVWRVRKTPEGYETVKVLEDRDMEVLEQISTVLHDVKTGRLFIGGESSRSACVTNLAPPKLFSESCSSDKMLERLC